MTFLIKSLVRLHSVINVNVGFVLFISHTNKLMDSLLFLKFQQSIYEVNIYSFPWSTNPACTNSNLIRTIIFFYPNFPWSYFNNIVFPFLRIICFSKDSLTCDKLNLSTTSPSILTTAITSLLSLLFSFY